MDDGTVDIRGCKGVRITSGPLIPVINPMMSSAGTNGIEIETGESQSITIKRGPVTRNRSVHYDDSGSGLRLTLDWREL